MEQHKSESKSIFYLTAMLGGIVAQHIILMAITSVPPYELGQEKSIVATQTIDAAVSTISYAKRRMAYSITNTSAGGQVISLSLSNTIPAAAGAGIVLQPNQTWTDANADNYLCWTGLITGISSGAGGTIAIYERSVD